MPWTPADATRHNAKADTPGRRVLWAKVANRTLALAKEHDDSDPEGRAIRTANASVDRVVKTAPKP